MHMLKALQVLALPGFLIDAWRKHIKKIREIEDRNSGEET